MLLVFYMTLIKHRFPSQFNEKLNEDEPKKDNLLKSRMSFFNKNNLLLVIQCKEP